MRKSLPGTIQLLIVLILVSVLAFLSACASGLDGIKLIAEDGKFNRSQVRVNPDTEVTIIFENRDSLDHNFAVYRDEEATQEIFVGEIISGQGEITYTLTAPHSPDTYYFRCDVHPETMTGLFIVSGTRS
jgi:plastocyanin